MANKIIYINKDRATRVASDGVTQDSSVIRLYYEEVPNFELIWIDETGATEDVSGLTWAAAVDDDFDSGSTPWCRILNGDIDSSDAANGKIIVPVDSNTSTFQAGIGTSEQKRAYFELRGLNGSSEIVVYARFTILAKNTLDPNPGTPPEPTSNYYTKTEADARFMLKSVNTNKALPESTTTNITLGDKSTYRAFRVFGTIEDSTKFGVFEVTVKHNGTVATLTGGIIDGALDFPTVSFDADISGDNVILEAIVGAHGEALTAVYGIIYQVEVAT